MMQRKSCAFHCYSFPYEREAHNFYHSAVKIKMTAVMKVWLWFPLVSKHILIYVTDDIITLIAFHIDFIL